MIWVVLWTGCSVEDWRSADLQLDIGGAPWGTEDRVRICVDGVGNLEEALGAGRVAFTGIPVQDEVTVTVDLLDEDEARLGRAGPIVLRETWQRTEWSLCEEDCTACTASGTRAEGEASLLLAIRFE